MTILEPPQRIGFVGLGQMGAPMARNLARAGFKLAVTDANAAAVKRLAGDVPCETPSDLAALGEACVEAWARAEQLLGSQADHTAIVKYWERLAGSEIKGV